MKLTPTLKISLCLIEIDSLYQASCTIQEYKKRVYFCIECLLSCIDRFNELNDLEKEMVFDSITLKIIEDSKFISVSRILTLIQKEFKKIIDKSNETKHFLNLALILNTPESPFTLGRDVKHEYFRFIDRKRLKDLVLSQKIYQLLADWDVESGNSFQSNAVELEINKLLKNEISTKELFLLYKSLYDIRTKLKTQKINRTFAKFRF